MRVYLSGKISGLPYEEAFAAFEQTETFLHDIGFDEVVNPMKHGSPKECSWEEHFAKDIALLMACDAIFLMDNWTDSLEACIEFDVANRLCKLVYFQNNSTKKHFKFEQIQKAINSVMGLKMSDYCGRSRKMPLNYARMIFIYQCRKLGMNLTTIGKCINRHHSTILHFLRKYKDDLAYNAEFREKAEMVDEIINPK